MPAQVTADHMAIAADAMAAATAGSVVNTWGDRFRVLTSSIDKAAAAYKNLLETWDADNGAWTAGGLYQWHYFLDVAHARAGDIWDSNYTLGVRILDAEAKMLAGGTDPNPTVGTEVKQAIQNAADKADKALRSTLPDLAGIGKTVMWVGIGLGTILILYAIGPSLQAGASVYRTAKESD